MTGQKMGHTEAI